MFRFMTLLVLGLCLIVGQAAADVTVTVEFKTSADAAIASAQVDYYYNGWHSFGTTDATGICTKDLPSGNYKFRINYEYASFEKWQNIADDPHVSFSTVLVTVELQDHTGTTFDEPGSVQYYSGGWRTFGDLSSGTATKELLPLNYKFSMTHAFARKEDWQNVADDAHVIFKTELVSVDLKDCNGNVLTGEGGSVQYYSGGWRTFGDLTGGTVTKELLPLNYKFSMTHNFIRKEQWQNVDTEGPQVDFPATLVQFQSSWTIKYYSGGWRAFAQPSMYLQPGTYPFLFGAIQQSIEISGCTFGGGYVAILRLKNHAGAPLSLGTARGGYGTAYGTWSVPGSTNTSGYIFDFRSGPNTTRSYEMTFNHTTQVLTQDVSVNPLYDFQTNLLTLRLETCASIPLDDAAVRYGPGNTFTTWWFPGGGTGSSATGETNAELLPGGSYSFEMQYQGTAQQYPQNPVTISGNQTLTWKTTAVTLWHTNSISFGGPTGDSRWFNKPTMELLAGTYTFHFRTGNRKVLTFSGCSFSYVGFDITLPPPCSGKLTALNDQDLSWIDQDGTAQYVQIRPEVELNNSDRKLEIFGASGCYTGQRPYLGYFSMGGPDGNYLTFKLNSIIQVGYGMQVQLEVTNNSLIGYTGSRADKLAFINNNPIGKLFNLRLEWYNDDGTHKSVSCGSNNLPDWRDMQVVSTVMPKHSVEPIEHDISLGQNYPNPFNPMTSIRFVVPEETTVTLQVFDMQGRIVGTLVDGIFLAGEHTATFDARDLPSGTYMYRLQADGQVFTKIMTLLK
ncbi:MAG: T9SS type A sorting domain-containing protein [Bacteroidetes bacterium]|nr:T9SS type A sorting domain-containing protein [Bacteroidota bacterium]